MKNKRVKYAFLIGLAVLCCPLLHFSLQNDTHSVFALSHIFVLYIVVASTYTALMHLVSYILMRRHHSARIDRPTMCPLTERASYIGCLCHLFTTNNYVDSEGNTFLMSYLYYHR